MTRARLPNRRPSMTETFSFVDTNGNAKEYTVTIGFDPETGRAAEIFLNGAKEGSQMEHILADAAVLVSIALQSGNTLQALSKSLARLPAVSPTPSELDDAPKARLPATVIGAALDAVKHVEDWAFAA